MGNTIQSPHQVADMLARMIVSGDDSEHDPYLPERICPECGWGADSLECEGDFGSDGQIYLICPQCGEGNLGPIDDDDPRLPVVPKS